MSAHTPGPWQVAGHGTTVDHTHERSRRPPVARCGLTHGLGPAGDEDRANAEFIVRACNSHDELLAALRELTRAWDSTQFPVSDRMDAALKDADAAIAKAEGR